MDEGAAGGESLLSRCLDVLSVGVGRTLSPDDEVDAALEKADAAVRHAAAGAEAAAIRAAALAAELEAKRAEQLRAEGVACKTLELGLQAAVATLVVVGHLGGW